MGLSPGGARLFRRVPKVFHIVGGLLVAFQAVAFSIPLDDADGPDGQTSESTLDVAYVISGGTASGQVSLAEAAGPGDRFAASAPIRREFMMRPGDQAHVQAHTTGDDARKQITCTLTVAGTIVAQQTGSSVVCSAKAGETERLAGAVYPADAPQPGMLPTPEPTRSGG